MAYPTPHSIEDVPLHVVARILGHLDTIQQLKVTASSHSTFRDAYKDNLRSTIQSVVANEIPEDIIPFSLALLESSRAAPIDAQSVPRVMKNLKDRTSNPTLASEHLANLTLSDFDYLSRIHTAVKSLGEKFCRDSLPLFAKWLGPESTHKAAPCDYFRIHRALCRHQIMCNLLCHPLKHSHASEEDIERERGMVLLVFSPWVNEQLVCIYYFLQRILMEAYDDVAAHDIIWGEVPVEWTEEQWWVDSMEGRVQRYLAHGLEFLSSLAKTETFDERVALLVNADSECLASSKAFDWAEQTDAYPHEQMSCLPYYTEPLWAQGLDTETRLAPAHEMGVLGPLASSLDGPDEPLSSTSCRAWLMAQSGKGLIDSTFDHELDANLWMCGYVIWEASGQVPADQFEEKVAAIREEKHFFQRLRASYDDAIVRRSEDMRTDLRLAGAKGYWPLEGIDFSKVRDLDEEGKKRVLKKWRAGTAGVTGNPMSESIVTMVRSMDSGEDGT